MDKVLADKKAICLFVLPAFLLFAGIILLPIFVSGYYSTLQWDGIGKGIFIGLRNYVDLFQSNPDGFHQSVGNAFVLAGLSVFVQLPLALFFALVLAKGVKGENFYRTVYFIPVIISTVAIGQLWMKIYHPSYGLLNSLLTWVGLTNLTREWLGRTDNALWSALIPVVWQYIGYHMLLMYTAAKSVPTEIYEAALIDGASATATAFKVTIPLIMPTLKVCVTFAVIGSLRSFDLIYILTNGGPVHATEMPSTVMFNAIFQKYMYGYGSAISVFIILACLILTIVIQKGFKNRTNLD
ncbi:MAG TPA: sugar ABC transporter permease [Bacillota bacterium]|nr:sugar ABC transporter permease [Bacillota bacterium]